MPSWHGRQPCCVVCLRPADGDGRSVRYKRHRFAQRSAAPPAVPQDREDHLPCAIQPTLDVSSSCLTSILVAKLRYSKRQMTFDPVQLTRNLVDIDSTTYHEGEVAAYLGRFLKGRGFDVESTPVPQPAGSKELHERANLYAGRNGETPDIVFSTHLDTVPPFIASTEDADYIYGRGSCDAKGIIAAQIGAAERLRDAGMKVGLLFVCLLYTSDA